MNREAKIYVAGHRGLVGSAIVRALGRGGYTNLLLRSHAELDLTDQAAVGRFFADERPQYVFLAAAKVGGILANKARVLIGSDAYQIDRIQRLFPVKCGEMLMKTFEKRALGK